MGPGVCAPRGWGPGPSALGREPEHRVSFLLSRGKAELCGSLGVDRPVSRLWVWEPLCSLQLAAGGEKEPA